MRLESVQSSLQATKILDFLIIDGNSADKTIEIAKKSRINRLKIINEGKKRGIGSAYTLGFKSGLEQDYDFYVQMDADLSHQPEEILRLLEVADKNTLVIGTRWITGGKVINWPIWRRSISKLGTGYAAKMLALEYKDLTSGFRVLPKELVQKLNFDFIKSRGYGYQIEIAVAAVRLGFKIKQVPITFIERQGGSSKMSLGIVFEAWKMVSLKGLTRMLKSR